MKNLITNIPGELMPGDILLYGSASVTDKLIEFKEGDPDTAHVEVYVGSGISVASRNGIGVNSYQFRTSGLVHVRRPTGVFVREYAWPWFLQVKGAPYGWGDIKATLDLVEEPEDAWTQPAILMQTGMDCDHFAAVFLWKGMCGQFDVTFDFRKLTPRDFKLAITSQPVWDLAAAVPPVAAPLAMAVPTAPDLSPRAEGEAKP